MKPWDAKDKALLLVEHSTRLKYADPVVEAHSEVRKTPVDTGLQRVVTEKLELHPGAKLRSCFDYFGTHVQYFNLLEPHDELTIRSNAVREAAADDDVWVIGLTGTGDGFCSGLDLSDASSDEGNPLSPQSQMTDDLGWVSRFPLVMREECEKPIVGGINGVAIGAGFSLAMATDIRLASSNARFLAGYARAGTSPDGGLTWTLAQALGYEGALRFLLEQEMISADEAHARGIVGEVVAADDFEARFLEYCELLTHVSPIAARQSKRMVCKAVELPNLRTHLSVEIGAARRGLQTEDSKEAVRAIMEKRKPVFTGR